MEHSGPGHRLATAIIALIIVFNCIAGINLVAAADSALALVLDSQNVYVLAGIECVVLFAAYIAAKYEPIPSPG